MKKRLLGLFDSKKLSPEQIYEKARKAINENEKMDLFVMARARGKAKKIEVNNKNRFK